MHFAGRSQSGRAKLLLSRNGTLGVNCKIIRSNHANSCPRLSVTPAQRSQQHDPPPTPATNGSGPCPTERKLEPAGGRHRPPPAAWKCRQAFRGGGRLVGFVLPIGGRREPGWGTMRGIRLWSSTIRWAWVDARLGNPERSFVPAIAGGTGSLSRCSVGELRTFLRATVCGDLLLF